MNSACKFSSGEVFFFSGTLFNCVKLLLAISFLFSLCTILVLLWLYSLLFMSAIFALYDLLANLYFRDWTELTDRLSVCYWGSFSLKREVCTLLTSFRLDYFWLLLSKTELFSFGSFAIVLLFAKLNLSSYGNSSFFVLVEADKG